MRDRALGKTRAERALGENMPKKTKKTAKKKTANPSTSYRVTNPGMFSGPRPSYQRYEVGQMSSDILNKQSKAKRKEGK